ncbi:hypothetical protein LY78DRAFT_323608 [Colletotrichum sublineola]|nr:hypothetical protein LY78DRAFT_323608 [Colletotrichum sublineola]
MPLAVLSRLVLSRRLSLLPLILFLQMFHFLSLPQLPLPATSNCILKLSGSRYYGHLNVFPETQQAVETGHQHPGQLERTHNNAYRESETAYGDIITRVIRALSDMALGQSPMTASQICSMPGQQWKRIQRAAPEVPKQAWSCSRVASLRSHPRLSRPPSHGLRFNSLFLFFFFFFFCGGGAWTFIPSHLLLRASCPWPKRLILSDSRLPIRTYIEALQRNTP